MLVSERQHNRVVNWCNAGITAGQQEEIFAFLFYYCNISDNFVLMKKIWKVCICICFFANFYAWHEHGNIFHSLILWKFRKTFFLANHILSLLVLAFPLKGFSTCIPISYSGTVEYVTRSHVLLLPFWGKGFLDSPYQANFFIGRGLS